MDKQAYIDRAMAEINEWRAQMGVLKAKIEKQKADARLKGESALDDASSKLGQLERRLQDVLDTTGDAWSEVKVRMDEALRDLRDSVERAKEHVTS